MDSWTVKGSVGYALAATATSRTNTDAIVALVTRFGAVVTMSGSVRMTVEVLDLAVLKSSG